MRHNITVNRNGRCAFHSRIRMGRAIKVQTARGEVQENDGTFNLAMFKAVAAEYFVEQNASQGRLGKGKVEN